MYNIIIVVQDEEESDLVFPNMQVSKQSTWSFEMKNISLESIRFRRKLQGYFTFSLSIDHIH
jgi:hypothetical protein